MIELSIKEYLKQSAQSFFIVVTLINAAMMVLGGVFYPEKLLDYRMFGYPILYGLCSMIPVLVMYSGKELTIRQLLVRKLIQLILIIVLLVLFIFGVHGICMENATGIAFVGFSIVIVYVLEEAISWLVSSHHAQRLTESLHNYQNR